MKVNHILKTCLVSLGLIVAPGLCKAESSAADAANRGQLSEKDYRFVLQASRGGMEEVQLGELARQKGTTQGVRDFGDRMAKDHTQANNELKQIVAQKSAMLPTQFTSSERSTMEDLQKATGADFDKMYVRDMIKDHKHDIKEFQNAAKDVTDPDLKAYAQKTIPILEQHLHMAQQLETSVKAEK